VRNFMYNTVSQVSEFLLRIIAKLLNFFGAVVEFFLKGIYAIAQKTVVAILTLVDKGRTEELRAAADQDKMLIELNLMHKAIVIKEEYLSNKEWTNNYTISLNLIAKGLMEDCDWSKGQVTTYIKGVMDELDGIVVETFDEQDHEEGSP